MMFGKGKGDDPLTLLQQGKYREAIRLLEAKLKRAPNDFGAKMHLAEALEGAGWKDEAAEIYRLEAEGSIQGGQRAQGAALLRKAVKLKPDDGGLLTRLTQVERGGEAAKEDSFSFDIDMGDEAAPAPLPAQEDSGVHFLPAEEIAIETEPADAVVERDIPDGAGEAPAPAEEPGQRHEFEIPDEVPVQVGDSEWASAGDPGELAASWAPGEAATGRPAEPTGDSGGAALEVPELEEEIVAKTQPGMFDASEVAVALPRESGPAATQAGAPDEGSAAGRPEDFLGLIHALFPELSDEETELLESVAMARWLDAGEVLIREEEEGDSLFIIARGRLEARGRFESGVFNLALLTAGDLIGEVGFLKRVPRTATVTASEPSLVLELPGAQTREQLALHPTLLENLETILQERVDKTLDLLRQHGKRQHGDPQD